MANLLVVILLEAIHRFPDLSVLRLHVRQRLAFLSPPQQIQRVDLAVYAKHTSPGAAYLHELGILAAERLDRVQQSHDLYLLARHSLLQAFSVSLVVRQLAPARRPSVLVAIRGRVLPIRRRPTRSPWVLRRSSTQLLFHQPFKDRVSVQQPHPEPHNPRTVAAGSSSSTPPLL
jgi:hypothetical protein